MLFLDTDQLEGEKGKNLKLETFLLSPFCGIFGKKSKGKWIKKREFRSISIFGEGKIPERNSEGEERGKKLHTLLKKKESKQ